MFSVGRERLTHNLCSTVKLFADNIPLFSVVNDINTSAELNKNLQKNIRLAK